MDSFDRAKAPRALKRLCPDIHVRRLCDLAPADLVAKGIRAVLLDLDNTLTPWRSYDLPPDTVAWLDDAKSAGLKLCIVSNTRNPKRLEALSEKLEIPYVRARMKPSRQGFRRAAEMLGVEPSEAAMVGDQLFTDIWGGNRAGMTTVLVERMHPREFFGTKISRLLERLLLAVFRRCGALRRE